MPHYKSESNKAKLVGGGLSHNEQNNTDESATLLSGGFLQTPENSEHVDPIGTSLIIQKASPEQKDQITGNITGKISSKGKTDIVHKQISPLMKDLNQSLETKN